MLAKLKELKELQKRSDATLGEMSAKLSLLDQALKVSKEHVEKITKLKRMCDAWKGSY